MTRSACWGVAVLVIGLSGPTAGAQVFNSGSDGSDGALDFSCPSPPCEIIFDPVALGLDLDGDNVFHFTTITVPSGVTVRLLAEKLNWAPVHWLASGAVQIDGTIDLSGAPGHPRVFSLSSRRIWSKPGPGGFPGGMAFGGDDNPTTAGLGPGGGPVPGIPGCCTGNGNGAGYGTAGFNWNGSSANNTYGSVFLLPLVGGSGGSGGTAITSRGGGAGGGALLIAGSESITVNGVIRADGGEAAGACTTSIHSGGGGSGGAIRLMAPVIDGTGTLSSSFALFVAVS